MRSLVFVFVFLFSGCASVPMTGYISRADHPYQRKFYAGFEKVVSSFIYVLKEQGWAISEADPSIYERDERYDNNGYRNLLIITDPIKKPLSMTSMHLNVFIHSMGNDCDVEIRYEARTHMVKQFTSLKNDRLVQSLLDAVDNEIGG